MTEIVTGVFRAKGREICALKMPLPPLDVAADRCWVQVIPGEGSFAGFDDDETIEFSEAVIDSFVANAKKRKTPIQFDYHHQGLQADSASGLVPSSGKILDVEKRMGENGAELWVDVEWTKKAAEAIRGKEVNFCSPAFVMHCDDKVTGKDQGPTLLSVGLTDMPFLEGQQPVAMSEFTFRQPASKDEEGAKVMAEETEEMKPDEMAEGEGKPEEMAEGEDKPEEMAEGDPEEGPNADAFLAAVSEPAGLDKAAALAALMTDDILNKVVGMLNNAADKGALPMSEQQRWKELELKAKDAKIQKLSESVARLEEAEKARQSQAVEAEADRLIADGYALDEQRDEVIWALSQDAERARKLFSKKHVPPAADEDPEPNGEDIVKLGEKIVQLSEQEQVQVKSLVSARYAGGDRNKAIDYVVGLRN